MSQLLSRQSRRGSQGFDILITKHCGNVKTYQISMLKLRVVILSIAFSVCFVAAVIVIICYNNISLNNEISMLAQTKDRLVSMKIEQQKLQQNEEQSQNTFKKLNNQITRIEEKLQRVNMRNNANLGVKYSKQQNNLGFDRILDSDEQESWINAPIKQRTLMLNNLNNQIINIEKQLDKIITVPRGAPINMSIAHLSSPFGYRTNPFTHNGREFHNGLDFAANSGTPVVAPAYGLVTSAGWMGDLGQAIKITHNSTYQTGFGHLSRINVQVGDHVTAGDVIGYVGSTGRSSGPHLHYIVYENGNAVNPRIFM